MEPDRCPLPGRDRAGGRGQALASELPQQVAGPDLVRDERPDRAGHVRPVRGDPLAVHLVAGDALQGPVTGGRRFTVGSVGPPEPLAGGVSEARGAKRKPRNFAVPAGSALGRLTKSGLAAGLDMSLARQKSG